MKKNFSYYYPSLISAAIILIGGLLMLYRDAGHMADEAYHAKQIKWFYQGRFEHLDMLTTLPGYHTIMFAGAEFANLFFEIDKLKLWMIRIESTVFNLFLIGILTLLLSLISPKVRDEQKKTLLIVTLPLIFPYIFLVYTEIASLIFILTTLYLFLRKKHISASLAALAALTIRQDNIIWIALITSLLPFNALITHHKGEMGIKGNLSHLLKEIAPYLIVIIVFLLFYKINGGVAVGDQNAHPNFSFHFGNIYFFLLFFPILLLPIYISSISKVIDFLKTKTLLSLVIVFTYLVSVKLFFVIDHPYNSFSFEFARNTFINIVALNPYLLWAGALLGSFSILTIMSAKMKLINPTIFLFFSTLSFSLHWLIEQRYMIIPFVLFILLSQLSSRTINYQIGYNIALCSIITYYVLWERAFFL